MARSLEQIGINILLAACRDYKFIGVKTIPIAEVEALLLPRDEDPDAPEWDEAALDAAAKELESRTTFAIWDRKTDHSKDIVRRRAKFVLAAYFNKLEADRTNG